MAELNGTAVPPEALQALALVNYGNFTSMRVHNQCIRGLSLHLDRLVRDCRILFDTTLDRERIRDFVRHAIRGEQGAFVVRVTIFDPHLDLGHPGASAEPSVLVTTRPAALWPPAPMRVQTVHYRRDLPKVKHVGLLGALWKRRQVQIQGYDDALFLDDSSFVSEGATWNVGFFDGERVVWPNAEMLPGVTMELLAQAHDNTITAPVNIRDIPAMRAAFATNTAIGVRAISNIDGMPLSDDHPVLEVLRKEYEEIPSEQV